MICCFKSLVSTKQIFSSKNKITNPHLYFSFQVQNDSNEDDSDILINRDITTLEYWKMISNLLDVFTFHVVGAGFILILLN